MKKNIDALNRSMVSGHLRRARHRIGRAVKVETSDAFVESAMAAAAVAIGFRLLRSPGVGTLLVRWAPMLAFMACYSRLARPSRGT